MVKCADEIKSEHYPSFEDLFLVGHRYNVPEMYMQVMAKILSNLNTTNSTPCQFRTEHFFSELRGSVIKVVVKICEDQVAKKKKKAFVTLTGSF